MPSEETKILEFNQYRTSDKIPFIIYADLKCFIEKINGFKIILYIKSVRTYSMRFSNVHNIVI